MKIASDKGGVTTSKKGWYDWRRHPYSKKDKASQLVRRAIDRGDMKRPKTCSRPGPHVLKRSDGRSAIFFHHTGGAKKPFKGEWLCAAHHNKEHAK